MLKKLKEWGLAIVVALPIAWWAAGHKQEKAAEFKKDVRAAADQTCNGAPACLKHVQDRFDACYEANHSVRNRRLNAYHSIERGSFDRCLSLNPEMGRPFTDEDSKPGAAASAGGADDVARVPNAKDSVKPPDHDVDDAAPASDCTKGGRDLFEKCRNMKPAEDEAWRRRCLSSLDDAEELCRESAHALDEPWTAVTTWGNVPPWTKIEPALEKKLLAAKTCGKDLGTGRALPAFLVSVDVAANGSVSKALSIPQAHEKSGLPEEASDCVSRAVKSIPFPRADAPYGFITRVVIIPGS